MALLSRREVLQGGGVICGGCLAGCTVSLDSENEESRVTKIELQNHTSDEQSVLVIIEDDGDQVYGEFTAVSPGTEDSPEVREVKDIPPDPGVYDIYFNLARRPEDIEGEFWARAGNTDAECREYVVTIRADDNGEPQLGIYRSDDC